MNYVVLMNGSDSIKDAMFSGKMWLFDMLEDIYIYIYIYTYIHIYIYNIVLNALESISEYSNCSDGIENKPI